MYRLIAFCIALASLFAASAEPARLPDKTTVTATLDAAHQKGQNLIWCGTFKLVWDAFGTEFCGGPVQLEGTPEIEKSLNANRFSERSIDAESIYVKAGIVSPKLHEEIGAALKKRFGPDAPAAPKPPERAGSLAYAFMFKNLAFKKPFESYALNWDEGDNKTPVRSFGIEMVGGGTPLEQRNQIVILYENQRKKEYVIELKTTSERDRLVLALVEPGATLKDTVSDVRERVEKTLPIQVSDKCLVPCVEIAVERVYSELIDKRILNSRNPDAALICDARQRIQFNLDEKGAVLKSESEHYGMKNGHQPRMIVFDRPFLLYMERIGAREPYLAIWFGNPNLFVKSTEAPAKSVPEPKK